MFKRAILSHLTRWKASSNRKPLILRGARQVGKTTLIKQFAQTYKQYIFLNLEISNDRNFFEISDDVKKMLLLSRN